MDSDFTGITLNDRYTLGPVIGSNSVAGERMYSVTTESPSDTNLFAKEFALKGVARATSERRRSRMRHFAKGRRTIIALAEHEGKKFLIYTPLQPAAPESLLNNATKGARHIDSKSGSDTAIGVATAVSLDITKGPAANTGLVTSRHARRPRRSRKQRAETPMESPWKGKMLWFGSLPAVRPNGRPVRPEIVDDLPASQHVWMASPRRGYLFFNMGNVEVSDDEVLDEAKPDKQVERPQRGLWHWQSLVLSG